MTEVIAFEQQWLPQPLGQGVGKAIAEIQGSTMSSLAELCERQTGQFSLTAINADDLNPVIGGEIDQGQDFLASEMGKPLPQDRENALDQAEQRIKTQAAGRSLLEVSIAIGGRLEILHQHCQRFAQLEPVAGGVCEEESTLSSKASILDSRSASRLFSISSCFKRLSRSSSLCSNSLSSCFARFSLSSDSILSCFVRCSMS